MRRATADEPVRSLRAKAEAASRRAGGLSASAQAPAAGGGEYWNLVTAVAVVAWLVVLGYSALMVQPEVSGRVRRVLLFPEAGASARYRQADPGVLYHDTAPGTDLVLRQEVRYVPYRPRMEPSLRLLVEETILGPADHRTGHLLPASARVISTHVADAAADAGAEADTDAIAYVNLSHHAWLDATSVPSTGAERIGTLADIILYNFPGLREVHVLIEGQEPRLDQAPKEGADDG